MSDNEAYEGLPPKRRLLIKDLNRYLTCSLCEGYYIDATTINECLHSFCRSCIVRYLESSKYCPTCDILVHKNKPLVALRPDKSLQWLVYKLIPSVYQNEVKRRTEFYNNARASSSCSEDSLLADGHGEQPEQSVLSHIDGDPLDFFCPDDSISLSLEYYTNGDVHNDDDDSQITRKSDIDLTKDINEDYTVDKKEPNNQNNEASNNDNTDNTTINDNQSTKSVVNTDEATENDCDNMTNNKNANITCHKRYLQCPAGVNIKHLSKFIRMKYGLSVQHRVDIIYEDEILPKHFTLMDVAYTFKWKRTTPMRFMYRIFESPKGVKLQLNSSTTTAAITTTVPESLGQSITGGADSGAAEHRLQSDAETRQQRAQNSGADDVNNCFTQNDSTTDTNYNGEDATTNNNTASTIEIVKNDNLDRPLIEINSSSNESTVLSPRPSVRETRQHKRNAEINTRSNAALNKTQKSFSLSLKKTRHDKEKKSAVPIPNIQLSTPSTSSSSYDSPNTEQKTETKSTTVTNNSSSVYDYSTESSDQQTNYDDDIEEFAKKRDLEWANLIKNSKNEIETESEPVERNFSPEPPLKPVITYSTSKRRKKSKHSKHVVSTKRRKLHAEIQNNSSLNTKVNILKLKVKLTPPTNKHHHKHKHNYTSSSSNSKDSNNSYSFGSSNEISQSAITSEVSAKERLLQMRAVRHKPIQNTAVKSTNDNPVSSKNENTKTHTTSNNSTATSGQKVTTNVESESNVAEKRSSDNSVTYSSQKKVRFDLSTENSDLNKNNSNKNTNTTLQKSVSSFETKPPTSALKNIPSTNQSVSTNTQKCVPNLVAPNSFTVSKVVSGEKRKSSDESTECSDPKVPSLEIMIINPSGTNANSGIPKGAFIPNRNYASSNNFVRNNTNINNTQNKNNTTNSINRNPPTTAENKNSSTSGNQQTRPQTVKTPVPNSNTVQTNNRNVSPVKNVATPVQNKNSSSFTSKINTTGITITNKAPSINSRNLLPNNVQNNIQNRTNQAANNVQINKNADNSKKWTSNTGKATRPPPATIPLSKIKKAAQMNLNSNVKNFNKNINSDIVSKMLSQQQKLDVKCDNFGALDLSGKSSRSPNHNESGAEHETTEQKKTNPSNSAEFSNKEPIDNQKQEVVNKIAEQVQEDKNSSNLVVLSEIAAAVRVRDLVISAQNKNLSSDIQNRLQSSSNTPLVRSPNNNPPAVQPKNPSSNASKTLVSINQKSQPTNGSSNNQNPKSMQQRNVQSSSMKPQIISNIAISSPGLLLKTSNSNNNPRSSQLAYTTPKSANTTASLPQNSNEKIINRSITSPATPIKNSVQCNNTQPSTSVSVKSNQLNTTSKTTSSQMAYRNNPIVSANKSNSNTKLIDSSVVKNQNDAKKTPVNSNSTLFKQQNDTSINSRKVEHSTSNVGTSSNSQNSNLHDVNKTSIDKMLQNNSNSTHHSKSLPQNTMMNTVNPAAVSKVDTASISNVKVTTSSPNTIPNLQTLKIPVLQNTKSLQAQMKSLQRMPKLQEINKNHFNQIRNTPNQTVRNIPNPSALLARQQIQNRVNANNTPISNTPVSKSLDTSTELTDKNSENLKVQVEKSARAVESCI